MGNIYKKIYKKIKSNKKIVIVKHIGPDLDALASSLALKEIIKNTFPNKEVYVIGSSVYKFKFLGKIDKYDDKDALLIIMDTPDLKRIDGANSEDYLDSIKIDHHPFVQKTCNLELIDETATSASEIVLDMVYNTKLKMNKNAAEMLYIGVVSDSERFMFKTSSSRTFNLISKLLRDYDIDIVNLYDHIYMRSYKEINFLGYLYQNLNITDNGFAYIVITDEIIKEYNIDVATAGNMINSFNHIEEILAWAFISEDKTQNNFRTNIRSRGPIVNEVASKYGGGGHAYASGIRIKDKDNIDKLLYELDILCKEFNSVGE